MINKLPLIYEARAHTSPPHNWTFIYDGRINTLINYNESAVLIFLHS